MNEENEAIYYKEWVFFPMDDEFYKLKQDPRNTKEWPFQREEFVCENINLGNYVLNND